VSLSFPIFDNKSLIQQITSKVDTLVSTGDIDHSAFIWIPSTGYGSMPHWEVNRTYAKQFLKDNMKWVLQGSANNQTWYDANGLLNIGLKWNESNCSYKVTLTLNTTNAPRDLYYRFNMAFNKTLKQYLTVDGTEWRLTIPANNTKDYTIFFNWSDIKQLIQNGKVWFDKGIKNNFFWFKIQTVNRIPVGTTFVIDPSYGVIPAAVTSSYEWQTTQGCQPSQVRINSSQFYLIVAQGTDGDGWAYTLKVWNSNGTINPAVISSYEFDTDNCFSPSVIHIPNTDKYAVAYEDAGSSIVKVITLKVWDTNGTINQAITDTLSLTQNSGVVANIQIINVLNGIYAVAYAESASSDGWFETLYIASSGLIGDTVNDTQEFNTTQDYGQMMSMIDADTMVIVYDGSSHDGYLSTWNISSAGIITNTWASQWEYETTNGEGSSIKKMSSSNYFLITYYDRNYDGMVSSVYIADTGAITKSLTDTLKYDDSQGLLGNIFPINDGQLYGVAYQGAGNDGWVCSFRAWSSNGSIDAAITDNLEFDTADCRWWPSVVLVNQNYYFIAYSGTDTGASTLYDGWSCVVSITTNYASPTFSSPSPTNSSTGQALTPQCAITVNDLNGDLMTVNFYENSTGSWVKRQTNSSCANGTYRWTFAQASVAGTKYWWKVYANDGLTNVSTWYCFTTIASASRTWHSLFSGYEKGGNATVPWRSLFSGYLKGGNATSSWRSLFLGYETGGNNTIPWRALFSGYLKGGNVTNYRSLFTGYLKGGNATIPWRSLFTGYLKGGNATVPWRSLFSGYFTGGNNTNYRSLFSGYITGGNITIYRSLFQGYETGGNESASYHALFQGWFSGGNISLDKIFITDVYPVNGSTAAMRTSLAVTVEQVDGLAFNISWYGSDDNGSSWFVLGSTNSVNNGTWGIGFWNASILNKTYYWRVQIVDTDLNYSNATYHYTTAVMGAAGNQIQLLGQENAPLAIMGGVLFVLPLGLLFMIIGKRKKQKEEKKQDDRADNIFNP
jgi:hypothetical protein